LDGKIDEKGKGTNEFDRM